MSRRQANPSTMKCAEDLYDDLHRKLSMLQVLLDIGQSIMDDMMMKRDELIKLLNISQDEHKSIDKTVQKKKSKSYADAVKSKPKTKSTSSDQLRINHRPSNGQGFLVTEKGARYNARKRKLKESDYPGKKKHRLNGQYSKIDIDLSKDSVE